MFARTQKQVPEICCQIIAFNQYNQKCLTNGLHEIFYRTFYLL